MLACAAYFTLQAGFAYLLQPVFAWAEPVRGAAGVALCAAVVALFMAALVLQAQASRRPDDPRWLAARVHLSNGLYVNTAANRLVQRLWPPAQRLSTHPSTHP